MVFRSGEGKELPVTVLSQGDICEAGERGWAAPDEMALRVLSTRGVVCFLSAPDLQHAVAGNPEALSALLDEYRRCTAEVSGLASDRLHPSPGSRIRRALWRDTLGSPDESICYTHEHLAARAGTSQPCATRELGRLREAGIIEVGRREHKIIVLDRGRLASDE